MKRMLFMGLVSLLTTVLLAQTADYFQPMKWRHVGPFRGGRSVAVSGVPGDPLTYFMGTTGGGLWKTEDAGQYWHNISDDFFKTGSVGAVAVSPSHPYIVYCGMGEHAPRGVMTSYGDGVYKSVDGGKTWQPTGLEKTQHIARIIVHPNDPNTVFVAAQGALYGPSKERGIYKSTDGGATWKQVLYVDENTGCAELDLVRSTPHILYATMWEHGRKPWKVISGGPGSGLYKSTDGGETWDKIQEGLPAELGKMAVSVCQSSPDKVYALVESDSNQEKGGLFVSYDGGGNWTRISDDHRLIQRAWYYIEVFADPQNENLVYVLSADLLKSIDGGRTWELMSGPHGDYHDLWINPDNPRNMVLADDGGAGITFNRGESWSTQANMPTAQMYRVNVDNLFPYHLYGGQQDNTSVRIAAMELYSSGINFNSWEASAGGESAFLAFDPDDPRYVMGGSYLGTIEVMDTRAQAGTNIMSAPIQYLALDAKDMFYRYNWNAPIVCSPHDTRIFYHAAQKLLRTSDMGQTWKEISPDLTRNEPDKQGKGGGPYTNEAVGAENYGTISYVVESPHEAGVIWTGSDDGLVYLTKNGGANWTNVTPAGMAACLVNAIEVSPFDPATAYIATTRYKFNDHTPALYVTRDYGKTWKNISSGIPYGAYTRVIREDPARKGLLYAGTETGVYVSWNEGAQWQPLQLNLPVVPITDMMVSHGDLILATAGRGYWILDEIALLHQYAPNGQPAYRLYQPEPAILSNHYSELNSTDEGFDGTHPLRGVNPANGIVVYYELPGNDDNEPLTLSITDATGKEIRRFSSEDSGAASWDGGPSPAAVLPAQAGLNRFVWDMRHASRSGVPGVYIEGAYRGHKVPPGEYTLTLSRGDQQWRTTATVLPNPLYPADIDYAAYDVYISEMTATLDAMHERVNTLKKTSDQLEAILQELPANNTELLARSKATLTALKEWDALMVQRLSKAYDDVENYVNGFTADYLFLINQSESDIPRIADASRKRRQELDARWQSLKAASDPLLQKDLPALNELLWKAGLGALKY
ncbi:MAG: glycosyl hydrolase [Saprospiraceae bacterium]